MARRAAVIMILFLVVVAQAVASQQPVTVRVTTAAQESVWREITYGARLRPRQTLTQRAPASGIIDQINIRPGQPVNRGDILMTVRRNVPTDSFRPVPVESFHTGVIAEIAVTQGQEVRDGDAVITIADTSSFVAELHVSDKDIDRIQTGAAVTAVDSGREQSFNGRVTRTALIPDYRTGLFPVEITLNPTRSVFVGQFLRFSFRTDEMTAILVPRENLELRGGTYFLYVVEDDKAVMRAVTLGPEYGTRVVIREGLSVGERYVISADRRLQNGVTVSVTAPAQPRR